MHKLLIEMLACPACHSELAWTLEDHRGERIVAATARCSACGAVYPVRDEIGVFLTPDLPRNDLWESGAQRLTEQLRDHPDVRTRLMDTPIDELGAADLFFRSMLHEERGEHDEAHSTFEAAWPRLYTGDWHACFKSQIDYVLESIQGTVGPIVDLASGRCYLVTELLTRLACPVVATDFSPRILRRDREFFRERGLYDRVSLLAFDARRTPFRDRSIDSMTTLLGLPNIENPGALLPELRRIVSGRLLAISQFYPPDDETNLSVLRQYGLKETMLRDEALRGMERAGWTAALRNPCHGIARPTPTGEILADAKIDALPVAETTLEWGVIEAA